MEWTELVEAVNAVRIFVRSRQRFVRVSQTGGNRLTGGRALSPALPAILRVKILGANDDGGC
jgi:hypothetical protein